MSVFKRNVEIKDRGLLSGTKINMSTAGEQATYTFSSLL